MNKLLLITSITIALLSACNPRYYIPNTQNVPLISRKAEKNISVIGNGSQIEIQGAYGITNKISIMVNGGLFIPKDLDNGNGGSGKLIEIGGGYYKPIKENYVLETYGIFGIGSLENHLPSTLNLNPLTKGNISANLTRFGIQPSFGYKSKYFSTAISSRIALLSYNNIKGDLISDSLSQVQYLKDNHSNLLFEPALTVRGGSEQIKFQLQFVRSFNLSNKDFKQDASLISFGLNFNLK